MDVYKNDFTIIEKNSFFKNIAHLIKKKKIFIDEERSNFKLDRVLLLDNVKNTSQIKGYPCVGFIEKLNLSLGLKINPIDSQFPKENHPAYLEYNILKFLTDELINTNITPHIVYYLGAKKISNKSRALKKIMIDDDYSISTDLKILESKGNIKNYSNLLISEFINQQSLKTWIFKDSTQLNLEEWNFLTFSLLYTLFIFQKKYKLLHNDCHYGNILIDTNIKKEGYLVYSINNKKYYFKNHGFIPKFWDFEFAMSYSTKYNFINKFIVDDNSCKIENSKIKYSEDLNYISNLDSSIDSSEIECTPKNFNTYYDSHYLLTSFLDLSIPDELHEFIYNLYPPEIIPDDDSFSSETISNVSSNLSDSDNISGISGNLSNNLSGNLSSNLSGNLSSNLSGNLSSNLSGNISSNLSDVSSVYRRYLCEGRLINSIEKYFKIIGTEDIINNKYFYKYTTIPKDYDEKNSLLFTFNF
jgi:hypothetical protein